MSVVTPLRTLALCAALAAVATGMTGCKGKSKSDADAAHTAPVPTNAPAAASAPAQSAAPSSPTPATPALVNVAGMSAGAFVVDKPRDDGRWLPLLNEVPDSVGIESNGNAYTGVIALAAPATIERLRFTRIAQDSAARHVQVQTSEQGQDGPWQTVFDADLKPIDESQRNGKSVVDDAALSQPARARWLRVSWQGGGSGMVSMRQFAALAQPVAAEGAQRDVSGVYRMLRGLDSSAYLAVRQDGATIRGCFGEGEAAGGRSGKVTFRNVAGTLEGGVEPNGYLRFRRGDAATGWRGVMSFSPDGTRAALLEFPASVNGSGTMQQAVDGVGWKVSAYQDNCPGLTDAQNPLDKALEAGRATLYGVNFDVDAATLRPESRPALDGVVKAAQAHPDWRLAIEGHTDNTGNDAHNQDLSQRRADSVRKYLADAGVPVDRLRAQGFGTSHPVAPNDNPAGRAQNRRVEVARQ